MTVEKTIRKLTTMKMLQ